MPQEMIVRFEANRIPARVEGAGLESASRANNLLRMKNGVKDRAGIFRYTGGPDCTVGNPGLLNHGWYGLHGWFGVGLARRAGRDESDVGPTRPHDAGVSYTCSNTREHFSEKIVRV
jgi:hypothetical protein